MNEPKKYVYPPLESIMPLRYRIQKSGFQMVSRHPATEFSHNTILKIFQLDELNSSNDKLSSDQLVHSWRDPEIMAYEIIPI